MPKKKRREFLGILYLNFPKGVGYLHKWGGGEVTYPLRCPSQIGCLRGVVPLHRLILSTCLYIVVKDPIDWARDIQVIPTLLF